MYIYMLSEELVTPEVVQTYQSGERARRAVSLLGSAHKATSVNISDHSAMRDYLVIDMVIGNAMRGGTFSELNMAAYRRAQVTVENGCHVFCVCRNLNCQI